MSYFRIPTTINKEIEALCANFWWGGKAQKGRLHWKNWGDLTLPKNKGSMGFRDLTIFNIALLAKHVWKMMMNPNTLVAQMFKNRYYKHTDIMKA